MKYIKTWRKLSAEKLQRQIERRQELRALKGRSLLVIRLAQRSNLVRYPF